jgi:putative lipoprotein
MSKNRFLVLAGVLLLVAGCSEPDHDEEVSDATPPSQTLTGEVFYRERKYVPPGAKLHITLQDVPQVGMPTTVMATSTILLAGSQPYAFALDYSPADIDAGRQYTLHAAITFYDELLFTSAKRVDPFEHPEDTISIQVKEVGSSAE